MNLHEVHRGINKHRRKRRIGRGIGSGRGKTAGRGHKGQKSHAGWKAHPTFQSGATPMIRRVPKRGFNNRFALHVVAVNVGDLNELFNDGDQIGIEQLRDKGLVRGVFDEVKVLGDGELTKKLEISAHRFSQSAQDKITQAGGQAIRVPGRTPVAERNKRLKAEKAAAKGQAGKNNKSESKK